MLSYTETKNLQQNIIEESSTFYNVFRALGDKTRFQIFSLLVKEKEICVTDVASIFSISLPAASYQLKTLETAGLVRRERMGQMICYEVKNQSLTVQLIIRLLSL